MGSDYYPNERLGNVAGIIMGQSPPGSTYNENGNGLPFFQGIRDFNYRHPSVRVFCSAPSRVAQPGDILLSVRAPIGRVNIADRVCCIGRGLSIVRAKSDLDQRFIEFVLRLLEPSWQSVEGGGSVFGNATKNDLESLPIPWPKPVERQAIAHILGSLDDKIELNRRMNKTLEAMARAIFKSWFVDFDPVRAKAEDCPTGLPDDIAALFPDSFENSELGEIPKGWEVGRLSAISEKPQYGFTASANDEVVGPKFLRIKDINKTDWIDWTTVPYCEIDEKNKDKYQLQLGDIVIARMADPGHAALIEEQIDSVFASYLIRFRPINDAYERYLQYWLRSDVYWNLARGHQTGSTRANLNAKVLGSFPVLVPNPTLAAAFKKQVQPIREKVVMNVNESNSLASLRDALLPKLISGEFRIPDVEKFIQEVGL